MSRFENGWRVEYILADGSHGVTSVKAANEQAARAAFMFDHGSHEGIRITRITPDVRDPTPKQ